jgi:hypothetical protein
MPGNPLKTALSFPVFMGAILVALVYHFANRGVADPDIWWHLRNAEYLLQSHHFIRADMYSFSVRGVSWINHEWLAEVPYYLAWRVAGLQGLFVMMMCLIEAVMLGTYWLGSMVSGNAKAAFVASWLAMFLATISFGPRTLLFGWIYLIVLLAVLWRYKHDGKDKLWVVPILFLFWVNFHGSWLIGMAVMWIFILSGLIEFSGTSLESRRWSRVELRRLLTIAAVSMAALFINPYGYKLVFYPFDLALQQKLNVSNIAEWASIDFHSLRGKILLGSILLTFILTVVRRQRWRLEWFVLFLVAVYASVTYLRFMFLAAIVITPILAWRLDMIPPYDSEKDKTLLNALFVAAAIGFMIWSFPSEHSLRTDVESVYPAKAIPYLQQQVTKEPGRVFNAYLWGGYMILNARDVPVFVDSRTDVFEHEGVLKDFLDFINLHDSLAVLEKHKIRYVFIESQSAQAYFMDQVQEWHAIYRDDVAVIYERAAK